MDKYEALEKEKKEAKITIDGVVGSAFKEGFAFGFEEGMLVAQDYVDTIIFQEDAPYPLSAKEIKQLFNSSDPKDIFSTYNIKTIMSIIKKYKEENSKGDTNNE